MTEPSTTPASTGTPWAILARYFRFAQVRPAHVLVPLVLSLLTAAAEGGSLALLMPIADALSATNYDFLTSSWAFGWLLTLLPDAALVSPRRDVFITLLILGLILGARLATLSLGYLSHLYLSRRNESYSLRVRSATFDRVLSFGRGYFDRKAMGRIDAEIGWSQSTIDVLSGIEGMLSRVVRLGIKVSIALSISVPLFVAAVVAIPVIQVLLRKIRSGMARIAREGAEAHLRMRTEVLDALTSIPLVKAYSQERQAMKSYDAIGRLQADISVRQATLAGLHNPATEGVILLLVLGVYGVIVWLSTDFRPGDLAALATFLLITQHRLPDYLALSGFRLTLIEQGPRLEALATLFDDEGKAIVRGGELTFPGVKAEISVRSLDFGYLPDQPVFEGLDATFPAGSMTAVVGRSGSGKTTLASLLCRFYECPPGSIFVDGVDIREYSLASIHDRMALASQDVWLLHRPIRDNLTWGLEIDVPEASLWDVLADVDLEAFVRSLPAGLGTFIGDRGVQLSGGQRQRLALARTLLREPDILILDEATSALDSVVERQVEQAVERRSRSRTLVVIAHRLSTIRSASRILLLDQGRLVESGTWEELLALNGLFAEQYRAQEREEEAASEETEIAVPGRS